MIENYLELLARELDFDRSLSRCVRQEVEDHLWEAVAADRVLLADHDLVQRGEEERMPAPLRPSSP